MFDMTPVQRGAELLDRKVPGWYTRIRPGDLDLASRDQCVLGQLFGDYYYGAFRVGVLVDANEHGFTILNTWRTRWLPWTLFKQFNVLTAEWRDEIAKRRLVDFNVSTHLVLPAWVVREEVYA